MGLKRTFFKGLAKLNKKVLPSFTKKDVDLSKASKIQLALFAYKMWVTKNAVNQ
ncbi:SsrA-binding protein [Flavobacteriaceae bacterium TK19130]|nr:SsrA-binding protein [Thermobacterium salinum]